MQKFNLKMFDNREMVVQEWNNVEEDKIKGIVQMIHGSRERILRYSEFAEYLNNNGYIFIGIDQRGHGLSADLEKDELGNFENGSELFVSDQYELNKYIKEKYPNKQITLIGHSLGSFIARCYTIKYSETIDKVIYSGTAHKSRVILYPLKWITWINKTIFNSKKEAKFLWKIIFGNLNFKWSFEKGSTGSEWQTKNEDFKKSFLEDELMNGKVFRRTSFHEMFKIMIFMERSKNIDKIRKDIPILITNGNEDPVGRFGKQPKKFNKILVKKGYNSKLKEFQGLRHEIVFEDERKEVMEYILEFMNN